MTDIRRRFEPWLAEEEDRSLPNVGCQDRCAAKSLVVEIVLVCAGQRLQPASCDPRRPVSPRRDGLLYSAFLAVAQPSCEGTRNPTCSSYKELNASVSAPKNAS